MTIKHLALLGVKHWHFTLFILTSLVVSIVWINNVSGHEARLNSVEEKLGQIPLIKQRVDDIAEYLNVPKKNYGIPTR